MKEYDLYIVPTPIGNLADITLRALEVLKTVDVIACEDIRVTQKLLNHYSISTKCISYHKFNEKERVSLILDFIKSGKKVALVSDAGTPLICDPGAVLINELKGVNITALPGASAVTTFLSQVSRADEKFLFMGFMPRVKNQIEDIVTNLKTFDLVFYESPNRLIKTLEVIKSVRFDAHIVVGRELTKLFEEIISGKPQEIIEYFTKNPLKGEIVFMIKRDECKNPLSDLDEKIKLLKNKNFKSKEISVILSELYGVNKNEVYKRVSDI